MSVLVLSMILCCAVYTWWWLKPRPRSPPAFPGALPLIGHAYLGCGDHKHLWKLIQRFVMYSVAKGGVIEAWIGPHSFYIVTDPDDCITLINTCINKPYFYDFANDFLNNGLVTAQASIWKPHRKLLNPAFNQQVLNTYVNEMNVQAQSLVSQLASKVGQDLFDVRKYLNNYTMSIFIQTSVGLDNQDQTTIYTDYTEGIEDLFALYCDRFIKVRFHLSFIFNWSAMKRKQDQLTKKLKNIINRVISKRKFELGAHKNQSMCEESTPDKFKPVLDQMLHLAEEQGAFTEDDIRDHLNTFVIAANDTSSISLNLMLVLLGSYQKVQERVFNELQEVLEHKDEDITKQNLPKLVYLEAVIKESMRLYPVVPIFGRKVEKDVNLKNCTMRGGSTSVIGVYGLLRHPMWGADADQFRPERWLDPATLPDHPNLINATFGIGKRNCIGKVYGMMVMKTALAHILRRYQVTGDIKNVVWAFDVLLKPVEGHHIGLTRRT